MKEFFKDVKKQVLTAIGVIIATASTLFLDVVKEKLGLAEKKSVVKEKTAPAPAQNITINLPEQKKDTVIKKIYVKPKPKLTETEKRKSKLDW